MRRWCWLLAILFGVGWAQRIDQVPNPRVVDGGWVVDMAGVLSAQQKARLNEMLSALERDAPPQPSPYTGRDLTLLSSIGYRRGTACRAPIAIRRWMCTLTIGYFLNSTG
jgi:hypothetical protein